MRRERSPGLVRRAVTMRSDRPDIVRHNIADARWTLPDLMIAVLADVHACNPWTPLPLVRRIAERVTALGADMILLPGDFIVDRKLPAGRIPAAPVIAALAPLRAPLGVHVVMGNHDWWDCMLSRRTGFRENSVRDALAASGFNHLPNRAVRVPHGDGFWLVGTDSQHARKHIRQPGFDDPARAFAQVTDDAPAILLAHEPDCFADGHARAFLQVSGHTHGGQGQILGWRPVTPSAHGSRYAWGHVREGGRHLVVSGGIGFSGLPFRVFQPPEITLIHLSGA